MSQETHTEKYSVKENGNKFIGARGVDDNHT